MNPTPRFFNPQPSHLNAWAQAHTAEKRQNGMCVYGFFSILLFASGGMHARVRVCVHTHS